MSAVLFYLPFPVAATPNGVAAPDASAYFYQTGTLTLLPIYSTSSLTTQLSNPITSDAVGRFANIYLDNSKTYRLVINDRFGAQLCDIDPYIPGTAPSAGSLQPYADAAAASAVASSGYATAAAGSATTATTEAGVATTQAGIATTQAGIATTQAGIATTEAGIATAAAANANASAVSAGATVAAVLATTPTVTVMAYGATGIGDETLHATSYATDITSSPITITQQTTDGLAINVALRALRAAGGGTLVFPKGTFTTYGYLERIDFPLKVIGAGRGVTILRNCAISPWSNGYGIFCVQAASLAEFSISDITLDGYATNRSGSGAGIERRAYPIGLYGLPKATIDNVESRNSPIDCFYTNYTNGDNGCYVQATNCLFSNSFRNTVSLVSGWNQEYTNCIIEKGGKVLGGTSPKYAIDIEPNVSTATIKNITFTNSIIREAVNVIVGGVWAGNVRFDGCRIESFGGGASGSLGAIQPYPTYCRAGEFTFNNCTFEHTDGTNKGSLVFPQENTGDYAATQFIELNNCRGKGLGFQGLGPKTIITDVVLRDSLMPVYLGGSSTQNLYINGLHCVNVFDANSGAGLLSSFGFSAFEGYGSVSNLDVRFDAATMVAAVTAGLSGVTQAYGIQLPTSTTGNIKMTNINAAGFDNDLPVFLGATVNTVNFRGWRTPNTPPADTPGRISGLSTFFFRNCTEYGATVTNAGAINVQTANYTLVLSDASRYLQLNKASGFNLTVPPNSSVAFPLGTEIDLEQTGAGTVTVVAGAGVTINALSGVLTTSGQFARRRLKQTATNVWTLA